MTFSEKKNKREHLFSTGMNTIKVKGSSSGGEEMIPDGNMDQQKEMKSSRKAKYILKCKEPSL